LGKKGGGRGWIKRGGVSVSKGEVFLRIEGEGRRGK